MQSKKNPIAAYNKHIYEQYAQKPTNKTSFIPQIIFLQRSADVQG